MEYPQLPPTINRLVLDLNRRKHREEHRLLLVEGNSQIEELAGGPWEMRYLIVSPGSAIPSHPDVPVYAATLDRLQRISGLSTSPGVIAVVEFRVQTFQDLNLQDPIIYLDGIADPGNLGTMLRTGEWFGVTQWLMGPGTVDPYSSKVVRAAMGSLARSVVAQTTDPAADLQRLRKAGYRLVATAPDAPSATLPSGKVCLMFGNEARGLGPELQSLADLAYAIPRFGPTESLNVAVACAIALYEFRSGA